MSGDDPDPDRLASLLECHGFRAAFSPPEAGKSLPSPLPAELLRAGLARKRSTGTGQPVGYNPREMETLPETPARRTRPGTARLAAIVLLYGCLVGLSVLTWFNSRRAAESAAWVDHTKTVLAELDAALAGIVRESHSRGRDLPRKFLA